MIVYPAIDLKSGKCVRLTRGDFDTAKIYRDDPKEMLEYLIDSKAPWVHIVDLDGAKQGKVSQTVLIEQLTKYASDKLNIQLGGGVRQKEDVTKLIGLGVTRIVIGSVAVSQKETVKSWVDEFGSEAIVLALDCMLGEDGVPYIQTHGWQEKSQTSIWDLLNYYTNIKYILCTDVAVDGMLSGPNINLYQQILHRYPQIQLIASGGVGSDDDLRQLEKIGVYGVVVGKALYENKINLASWL